MKNSKRVLSMVIVLVFVISMVMTTGVFAAPGADKEKTKGSDKADAVKTEVKDKTNSTVAQPAAVETEEQKAVKEKDKVMEQKKVLTKQLIEARKAGNVEEAAKLLAQVKAYKEQLKLMVRKAYTAEEMAQLQAMTQTIEASDPSVDVLPVDTIVAKGKNLKLDIPPVVKDGKVLVPVKAFSQAYGAEVKWNAEAHTITIVKEGLEVVITVGSSIAMVNGVATDLGLPVKGINGRNVIPVGFLAAKLGLKTEVDPEDGTIEIEEVAATGTTTPTVTPVPTVVPTTTPTPTGTSN